MMRCPVCRADDNHTEQCRRCKADLTLLVRLERQRAACLASAERHAGRGEAQACLADAQSAHALRGDSESLRLIALAALLKRDFAAAWQTYLKRAKLL
jgi:hypothetical protein